jgi:hypothetical protein
LVDVCEPGLLATTGAEEPAVIRCSLAITGAIVGTTPRAGVEDSARAGRAEIGLETTTRGVLRTLEVRSMPEGALIRLSVADRSGAQHGPASFERTYELGGAVELVAPPSHKGKPFRRWRIDGIDQFDGVTRAVVALDYAPTAHTATALYEQPTTVAFTYVRAVARAAAVELSWQTSPDTSIAGYRVCRAVAGRAPAVFVALHDAPLPATRTSFRDSTVARGSYCYRLVAILPGTGEVRSRVVDVRVTPPLRWSPTPCRPTRPTLRSRSSMSRDDACAPSVAARREPAATICGGMEGTSGARW